MDIPLVTSLRNKGIPIWFSGDSHLVMDCPKCERERKLYYNYKKHIGDCKVCGQYFRLVDLYEHFHLSASHKPAPKLSDIKRRLKDLDGKKLIPVLPIVNLPYETSTKLPIIAERFLRKREVPTHHWNKLQWCPSGFYANRIIIPILDETDRIVGFQSRSVLEDGKDKYLFNKGATKRLYIYNRPALQINPVIVVENAFNALWLEGVTTFGKQISEEQMQTLSHSKQVCVIWDYDSWGSGTAYKLLEKMKKLMKVKAIMLTPEQPQPDNWSKDEILHAVHQAMSGTQLIYRMDTR